MAYEEKESIAGMAIISVTIAIVLAITTSLISYGVEQHSQGLTGIGTDSETVWQHVTGMKPIVTQLDSYKPDSLTCEPGITNCTESISSNTALQNTGFDPLQAYVQIKRILGAFMQILALTVFAPMYVTITLGSYIHIGFLNFIIILFGFAWQVLNAWLVAQIFIKK